VQVALFSFEAVKHLQIRVRRARKRINALRTNFEVAARLRGIFRQQRGVSHSQSCQQTHVQASGQCDRQNAAHSERRMYW